MYQFISLISAWAIPVMITFIPLYAFTRKVPVYESFVEGAKDGFGTAIAIIPHLVGMLVAISVFRASGALDFLWASYPQPYGGLVFLPKYCRLVFFGRLRGLGRLLTLRI